ncbi:hypothetical protein [Cohnella thailandensis]|uniref:Uncharacterized protein n=1 Tax=Cohnella thailandensis TaxID=557557 RepID=A0A841T662_9BACL|nr:hypothetical protein [Cohnella thailandensis]MBB6637357.1 hypothetical protein [Cohnella thailandensis]MBP1976686.1 hypothetical protein [Cohnella thailandensis]
MKKVGRKIYYDRVTGNVLVDTGERSGEVIETTQEGDFASYGALAERIPETVGVLHLEFGQYAADFTACNGYRVDIKGEEPILVFSYPNPSHTAEPVYQKPLTLQVAEQQRLIDELKLSLSDLQNKMKE